MTVETDIEDRCAMGQPADGNQIDAGRGDGGRRRGVILPDASVTARPATIATAWRNSSSDMLSSSTASGARASASSSWASVSTSTSILTRWPTLRAHALDGRANSAGDGDVVVLDQDGVVEAEAVIGAATGAHGVFFDSAQAGRRLARADDPGACGRGPPRRPMPSRWRCRSDGRGN